MTPAAKLFTATKVSSIEQIMKMMQSHGGDEMNMSGGEKDQDA